MAFYWATRFAYYGFDKLLWPGRLLGFGLSMVVFSILSYYIMGETVTLKTILSIILSIAIVLLQLL